MLARAAAAWCTLVTRSSLDGNEDQGVKVPTAGREDRPVVGDYADQPMTVA